MSKNSDGYGNKYDCGGMINMSYRQRQQSSDKLQYNRKHPESSLPSDLTNPLLRLNRISENSSQGNTIDMVRLQRRNLQNRVTKVNNYRQFYTKHSNRNIIINTNRYRYNHNDNNQSINSPQANRSVHQYSPSDRLGLESSQKNFYRLTFRPSQINLLKEMDASARNRVIGWLLVVVFIMVYLQFVLLCGVVLNEGYVSNESNNRLTSLFTTVLFIYSLSQCLYHISIYIIHCKTYNSRNNSTSLLIDTQAANLEYLLKCRDFTSQQSSFIERVIKSPKFTILIIVISTILLVYGTVVGFYHSEITQLYENVIYSQYDNPTKYSLYQIVFYLIIMPDVMSFLFFQQMHIFNQRDSLNTIDVNGNNLVHNNNYIVTTPFDLNQHHMSQQQHIVNNININNNNNNNNNYNNNKQNSSLVIAQLTVFNINSWWMRMSLGIFFIAIIYSLVSGKWWLGVIVFAKIELCFIKYKYRIDLFWVQFVSKAIIVVVCGMLLIYEWWDNRWVGDSQQELVVDNNGNIDMGYNGSLFISFDKFLLATMTITISLLLSRLLASHYMREQLYKHLFQQMQIITYTIIGSFIISYLIYQYILNFLLINFINILLITIMQVGLLVGVWIEGRQREQINLDVGEGKEESCGIQMMQRYQI